MSFDISQNRLLENMRQIELHRKTRQIGYACEIDIVVHRSGVLPLVKGFASPRMLRSFVCMMYLSLLTMLLLSPNPVAIIGMKHIPSVPGGDKAIHFVAFTFLTILVHTMRWPKPLNCLLIVLLLGYGASTEALQAFVPPRTVDIKDCLANFLGIATGSGIYWSLQRTFLVFCGLATSIAKKCFSRTEFNAVAVPCYELSAF